MMKFMIEIRTDNSAYEESFYDELIANLKLVINMVDSQQKEGVIRDTNGNKVGKFYTVEGE
jgi:hypothetical protein